MILITYFLNEGEWKSREVEEGEINLWLSSHLMEFVWWNFLECMHVHLYYNAMVCGVYFNKVH